MRLILVLLALLVAPAVSADSLFSMGSREDGRMWEAVGRLDILGKSFCTGALVAPDQVLTAAHCLYDPETGEQISVDEIQFLAGWRNGRAAAYRRVRRAVVHNDYDFAGPNDSNRVRNDVALLELQHPIRVSSMQPFPTGERPAPGDNVGVVSYGYDRAEAPAIQDTCEVITRQEGVLVMSCQVDFGASGSPVFSFDEEGKPSIVSVVSAKAEADGRPVSLGTSLTQPLIQLRTALASGEGLDPALRRTTAGNRNETGAKFIRP